MRILKILAAAPIAAIISGCASVPSQSRLLKESRTSLPENYLIQNVKFVDQVAGNCGPVTLSMAMQWAGKNVSPGQLASQTLTPAESGSFQTDLIGAARRNGMLAVSINSYSALLAEISAGHPVIVFENLGLNWIPRWHYALAVGFDFNTEEIILHSGHDDYLHEDMRVFENSWKLADYWALVILPPGELAASADERAHVRAAVGLEQAGKTVEAEKSYLGILQKWPESLVSLIGLANIAYNRGKILEATRWLRLAIEFHPNSTAARHNLKVIIKSTEAAHGKAAVR